MENLLPSIFAYAHQQRVSKYLQTPKYHRAVHALEEGWEAFRSGLTEEQNQTLDSLLEEKVGVDYLEDQASFLAGVAIGLDLGRL